MILRISYINCLLSLERLCRSKLGTLHDTLLQQLHPTKPVVTICCIFHGDFKFSHHQNVTFYRFLQYHFTFLCWNSSWEFVFEHPRILRILNSPAMSSHVQPSPAISSHLQPPLSSRSSEFWKTRWRAKWGCWPPGWMLSRWVSMPFSAIQCLLRTRVCKPKC